MDLKPDNILINEETKEIKISDFGNSKILSNQGKKFLERGGRATWLTMPPEMIEKDKWGRKVDSWALGVILYWMCALKHPFDFGNDSTPQK